MNRDFVRVLEVLDAHGVEFVLIGGVGAIVQGSPVMTEDIDVCHARTKENLERLATALRSISARLRGAPEGLPFVLDGETLRRGDSFTFQTDLGPVDVLGTPAGSRGYEELRTRARWSDLEGHGVWAASVDDLIAMKKAAGRPKDLAAIPHLEALKDELDHFRDEGS